MINLIIFVHTHRSITELIVGWGKCLVCAVLLLLWLVSGGKKHVSGCLFLGFHRGMPHFITIHVLLCCLFVCVFWLFVMAFCCLKTGAKWKHYLVKAFCWIFVFIYCKYQIRGKLQVADSAYVRKFNSCVCLLVVCFIGRDLLFLSILLDIVLNMHQCVCCVLLFINRIFLNFVNRRNLRWANWNFKSADFSCTSVNYD